MKSHDNSKHSSDNIRLGGDFNDAMHATKKQGN